MCGVKLRTALSWLSGDFYWFFGGEGVSLHEVFTPPKQEQGNSSSQLHPLLRTVGAVGVSSEEGWTQGAQCVMA